MLDNSELRLLEEENNIVPPTPVNKKLLITGKYCNKCKAVESKIPKGCVRIIDAESPEALAEMAYFELLGRPASLPIYINGEKVIEGEVKEIIDEINGK